ncbi:hypothetical protein ACJ7K1_28555 [Paenibacillus elgii]
MGIVSEDKDIVELNYSTKDAQILLREFVILLHEVSQNYENAMMRVENEYKQEIHQLKTLLQYYETNATTSAKSYKLKIAVSSSIKTVLKRSARFLFKIGKKIILTLGLKEQIKQMNFYKKLQRSGIIDRLKGRV